MDTRVSAIAGDRAGSLGMGFRGLAVKGSGVRIPSAPRETDVAETSFGWGFGVSEVVYLVTPRAVSLATVREGPREFAGIWSRGGGRPWRGLR
jgi:hypothetical protein